MTTEPTWLLSDGTTVRLGGRVEGDGPAAGKLRYDLETLREGLPVSVPMYARVNGRVWLDVNDAAIVHCWIRDRVRFAKATIVSAPELPHSEADDAHDSQRPSAPPHAGRVY